MSDLQINQVLDMQERGLHYGDGLFETGCDKLHIPLPDEKWLLEKIEAETKGHDSAVIKLIVTRGIGGRGLELPLYNQASVFVLRYPYTAINQAELEIDVGLCQTRLPINQNLAGLKHLNRLDYVLAAIELGSNLFFCSQGEVYTPSLEFAGVEGIMRQQILKHLEDQAIPVHIGRFQPDLLLNASECFLCNSVHGVRPIRSIDDAKYSNGAISQMLIKAFNINGNLTSMVTS